MARIVDTAEVAKMVRAQLRNTFGKATKFSVRIDRYSMGSSVSISWTDGPLENVVLEACGQFTGGRFQGLTDCSYSANSWYCAKHGARTAETYGSDTRGDNDVHESRCCAAAELVHFGNTSLQASRQLSPELATELTAVVAAELGIEIAAYEPNRFIPEADDFLASLVFRASLERGRQAA